LFGATECSRRIGGRSARGIERSSTRSKRDLRRRMHGPVPQVGKWLKAVVERHNRYYGVPANSQSLSFFRFHVALHWFRSLRRRSQRRGSRGNRCNRLIERWLPPPRIHHPYPLRRLGVTLRQEPDALAALVRICGGVISSSHSHSDTGRLRPQFKRAPERPCLSVTLSPDVKATGSGGQRDDRGTGYLPDASRHPACELPHAGGLLRGGEVHDEGRQETRARDWFPDTRASGRRLREVLTMPERWSEKEREHHIL